MDLKLWENKFPIACPERDKKNQLSRQTEVSFISLDEVKKKYPRCLKKKSLKVINFIQTSNYP